MSFMFSHLIKHLPLTPNVLTSSDYHTEPNLESGANIDCCKLYRENKAEYERIVRQSVREQLGL